jgi:hypothetical protein
MRTALIDAYLPGSRPPEKKVTDVTAYLTRGERP